MPQKNTWVADDSATREVNYRFVTHAKLVESWLFSQHYREISSLIHQGYEPALFLEGYSDKCPPTSLLHELHRHLTLKSAVVPGREKVLAAARLLADYDTDTPSLIRGLARLMEDDCPHFSVLLPYLSPVEAVETAQAMIFLVKHKRFQAEDPFVSFYQLTRALENLPLGNRMTLLAGMCDEFFATGAWKPAYSMSRQQLLDLHQLGVEAASRELGKRLIVPDSEFCETRDAWVDGVLTTLGKPYRELSTEALVARFGKLKSAVEKAAVGQILSSERHVKGSAIEQEVSASRYYNLQIEIPSFAQVRTHLQTSRRGKR